ncbi:hypothetical protein ASZ78_013088, partial [Callipepla squamata]
WFYEDGGEAGCSGVYVCQTKKTVVSHHLDWAGKSKEVHFHERCISRKTISKEAALMVESCGEDNSKSLRMDIPSDFTAARSLVLMMKLEVKGKFEPQKLDSLPYQIHWVQQTCSLVNLVPQCVSVKSRGALLSAFARDGLLLAVAVNQIDPKSKGRHLCLRSLLSLKDSLLKHTQNHTSIFFNVPKFLEEDTTAVNEKTVDLLDYEDESDEEKLFHNSSSSLFSQRIFSFVGKADQGHIEFASMFDTIHAEDSTEKNDKLPVELNSVQRNLLTAWLIGISKDIEERDTFLNYTMVSHTLSNTCIPQYENLFASPGVSSLVELDSFIVPVFQFLDESATQEFSSLQALLREPPQTLTCGEKTEKSYRLTVLWQLLYKRVVCYWIQLNRKAYKNTEEENVVSLLLSHIQATLQSSGLILEQHFKINSIAGEEKFLLGAYRESVDVWKRCLCEIKAKVLFILLDTKYSQHELWMITNVHSETAMAVIRSMARFMAAYFTNQLLYIFPPHSVDILHPLHVKPDISPRIIPLQHHLVTRAIRAQNLSSVWTVEYALDLFFVGGLIPEAVWLTHRLGDWKLSVSIGVAYTLYCQNSEFAR